ncbi:MAG: hypothetical protein IKE91_08795, partial [Clostridia bacterium]|nr:hypothetical protein [Clostridia bacterium]
TKKNQLEINNALESAVNTMMTSYSEVNKSWYEASYIESIDNKVSEYNATDKDLSKISVREKVIEIEGLINGLSNHLLPADYTVINGYKEVLQQEVDKEIYEALYPQAVRDEIEYYLNIIKDNTSEIMNKTKDQQDQVDSFALSVKEVIDNLQASKNPAPNYAELIEELDIDESKYTVGSLTSYKESNGYKVAKEESEKEISQRHKYDEQDVVEEIINNLKDAKNLLKEPADYTSLDQKISESKEVQNKTSVGNHALYTEASWNNLQSTIQEAENLSRDLDEDSQNVIEEEITKLNTAMTVGVGGLEYHEGYYENVESKLSTLSEYGINVSLSNLNITNPSMTIGNQTYEVFTEGKINDLQSTLNNIDTTKKANEQETIEEMATNVEEKITALTVNNELKQAVKNMLDTYEEVNKSWYEASYIENIDNKISEYNATDKDLKKQSIRESIDAIEELINNLDSHILNANYDNLDARIKVAEKIENKTSVGDHALYTETTWNKLQQALTNAKNISREIKINNQTQVDEMETALESAMTVGVGGLEYHEGYYENVETALSTLSEKSIEASLNNLNITNPSMTLKGQTY